MYQRICPILLQATAEQNFKPYLELLMTIEQQDIHRPKLRYVSMPLKLLPYLGSNRRDGHVQGVHLLDFGPLTSVVSAPCLITSKVYHGLQSEDIVPLVASPGRT